MSLTYINPVELLNLAGVPVASIDAAIIKKRRKELLADLELGDGLADYKGQRLDRSACERACTELDEPEHLRVWHRLANMQALNDFLGNGRTDFLLNPASASSLLADNQLLRLVGQRYAVQYDQALLAAFRARDIARIKQVAAAPALYLPSETRQAHQSLSRLLREKLEDVREQTDSFDEDDDESQVLATLTRTLNLVGWTQLLNALPTGFFAGLRTELAMAVRNFSIQFHNTYFEQAPALKLLQEAATLQLDGQSVDRIHEDIRQIREIETKKLAQAKIDAVAERFGKVFEQLLAFQKQIDSGSRIINPDQSLRLSLSHSAPVNVADLMLGLGSETTGMNYVRQWNTTLATIIAELNAMSDADIATARDSLAMGLRGLSVSIWNKNQADGDTAVALLTTGLTLRVSSTTINKLNADKQELARMIAKRKQVAVETGRRIVAEQKRKEDTSSGCLIFGIIAIVIIIIIALASSGKSSSSSNSSPTLPVESTTVEPTATSTGGDGASNGHYVYNSTTGKAELVTDSEESKYVGNQLRNGASPLDNCFGRGRYAGPAWVNFKNDNNDTDAIVCLARTSDNKVIRNEYIRAGTSFRMSRIPAGSYYLKVFYGQNWNPTRRSACGTKGYFDTDQRFSESREAGDLILISSNSSGYTTGTMTLYSVAGGNMAQQSIDATEFFRQ